MHLTLPASRAVEAGQPALLQRNSRQYESPPTRRSKVSIVTQKPLELILARNLMSALSTPAFLVDEGGVLVFYNESAGALLGKRFEELGTVGAEEWGSLFGPFDEAGDPITYDELPLVVAVRHGRA